LINLTYANFLRRIPTSFHPDTDLFEKKSSPAHADSSKKKNHCEGQAIGHPRRINFWKYSKEKQQLENEKRQPQI
jgi:hypothetical protein